MGIGDFLSDITPDVVEDAVEDATEWVGDGVEAAGDWSADRLQDVGWDSGADWVREQSRSLANRMGAEVDELDLGQTEDKSKLIYGSASKLRSTAAHLKDFQKSFTSVGEGLKGLDSSAVKGEGADAFRETVAVEPPKWFKGADAYGKAAEALETFASTVEWAQDQAQTAIEKWKAGTKASADALDAFKAKTETYNQAVDKYNAQPAEKQDLSSLPPKPGKFVDPGTALMKEAQEILAEARRQRNSAAETARTSVRAARDAAPPKPSYAEQAKSGLDEIEVMQSHFVGGIIKGTAGLVTFVRSVNPLDPYNLTHPAEYGLALSNTAAGLVQVANDPWGAGKQMVTGFMKDPAEGFGRLVPDLLLTAATGGGGAAVKGARIAKEAADLAADASRARKAVDDAPAGTHDRSDGERTTQNTDPVDLATGRMFLPQTDVVLPGTLPLVFSRRVESGYRAGRFFGPSWSSTVDERLEVDPVGVVHVTADGLFLTYPHPAPGLPTAPETGRARARLVREDSGDYTITDPDTGLVRSFTVPLGAEPGADGDIWLTQITDRNHNTVTIDRTETGAPLAIAHSGGYHLVLTTDEENGRITALELADGDTTHPIRTYGYTNGDLTTVSKPSGATLTFEYDEDHRVTAWIDSNNSRYDYVYDDRHRVIGEGGEAGHYQLTLAYGTPDPATGHRTTTLTTARGHTTRHLIDRNSRTLATTNPLGHTARYTYDSRGNQLSHTDPLGHTTTYTYDGDGRLTSLILADTSQARTEYDSWGLPTAHFGRDGTSKQQEYDERGNLVVVTDQCGSSTRWTYDAQGRPTSVTDAQGGVAQVLCDGPGLPLRTTDPAGSAICIDRDGFGRPVRITDPLGAITQLAWSSDGELTRRTSPDGAVEAWAYDGEGNCTSHTDAVGRTTLFEYTHFDLLSARTDPDGTRHEFSHDNELRLTEVTNPQGKTWSYTYDRGGYLASETDFDGRTLTYSLDPAGRLRSLTNALGQVISYERDQVGRVINKDVLGEVTHYAYDRAGRLTRAAAPNCELTYQYDRRGRVKTEVSDGYATTYAYDALGRRTRRTTPTGQVTSYSYDAAGHLARLTSGEHHIVFTRDASGHEHKRTYGESLAFLSTWNAAGRLSAESIATDTKFVNHRAYTYRADGQLTSLSDALRGTSSFELDAADRVTSVTAAGWTETYAYDSAGNQTHASWPTVHPRHETVGERVYEGTNISRAGSTRYRHDTIGRVIVRQRTRLSRKPDTWHYSWNAEDLLTGVTTPDGVRWRYCYDPLGRRTAKQRLADDGETVVEETRFTWDGTTLCEQTSVSRELPNPITLTWDHHGRRPLAQTERIRSEEVPHSTVDERFFAIATDIIGTPTELISETGDIAWRCRSTLWGITAWNTDASGYTPLRFPGQYHDPETGLHYNYLRHYDPGTGRYVSPDPLGLAPNSNPVSYVGNPKSQSDYLGLAPNDYSPDKEPEDKVPSGEHYSTEDLARVAEHLGTRVDPWEVNDAMIANIRARMEAGLPLSEGQIYFMRHELTEAKLMDEGMPYEEAHEIALKTHPHLKNYSPDVIAQYPGWFSKPWRKAWGMD
ncbi:putative T7SS-secreted protein [Streptomyces sp. NPDC005963]|uniref:putative T7SS-secreted protein n=1 Tax=Streptomyces sp. NPDC005963 TaxID=3156721 RepID=UPI0033EA4C3A